MERNIPPSPPSWQPDRPPRWTSTASTIWSVIGITLAAVVLFGGLLYLAFIVVVVVGLNQWAANK